MSTVEWPAHETASLAPGMTGVVIERGAAGIGSATRLNDNVTIRWT